MNIWLILLIVILVLYVMYNSAYHVTTKLREGNTTLKDVNSMHNLVRVIGTEVDDNLNTDLDTDIIDADKKCKTNPSNVIDYLETHIKSSFKDKRFLKTEKDVKDGDCGFFVDGDTLHHSAIHKNSLVDKRNGGRKFIAFDNEARDFMKSKLNAFCSDIGSPCEISAKRELCSAVQNVDDISSFNGVANKVEKLGIDNKDGNGNEIPLNPTEGSSVYRILSENLNKTRSEGGPMLNCECYDEDKIRANGNKLTEKCTTNIYSMFGCNPQGMTYLKDKYNKMYNEYVGIDEASVGNIKSIVKKVDNMKDLVSRLKKAIRGDNLKNDTSRFGRIFQKGDTVDLALEAQERIRVCKGANASNITEGFRTKEINRVETVGNTEKYLKMYQDIFEKGAEGDMKLCSSDGDAYPITLENVPKGYIEIDARCYHNKDTIMKNTL